MFTYLVAVILSSRLIHLAIPIYPSFMYTNRRTGQRKTSRKTPRSNGRAKARLEIKFRTMELRARQLQRKSPWIVTQSEDGICRSEGRAYLTHPIPLQFLSGDPRGENVITIGVGRCARSPWLRLIARLFRCVDSIMRNYMLFVVGISGCWVRYVGKIIWCTYMQK